MPFINDSTYEERVLELVEKVFTDNGITQDATDYAITDIQPVVTPDDIPKGNTRMLLAPINTNLNLENLELFYDREDLATALAPYSPYVEVATSDQKVSNILDQILESIQDAVSIEMNDVYDTYVVEDQNRAFVQLHALPQSFFYIGEYEVPVRFVPRNFTMSFSTEIVNKPVGVPNEP